MTSKETFEGPRASWTFTASNGRSCTIELQRAPTEKEPGDIAVWVDGVRERHNWHGNGVVTDGYYRAFAQGFAALRLGVLTVQEVSRATG